MEIEDRYVLLSKQFPKEGARGVVAGDEEEVADGRKEFGGGLIN